MTGFLTFFLAVFSKWLGGTQVEWKGTQVKWKVEWKFLFSYRVWDREWKGEQGWMKNPGHSTLRNGEREDGSSHLQYSPMLIFQNLANKYPLNRWFLKALMLSRKPQDSHWIQNHLYQHWSQGKRTPPAGAKPSKNLDGSKFSIILAILLILILCNSIFWIRSSNYCAGKFNCIM